MEKKVLQVEGMSCNHCKMAVEKAVKAAGGEADVNLAVEVAARAAGNYGWR